ncbi:MAG: VOC family protein [Candidatus Nanopelagicales bacterium]
MRLDHVSYAVAPQELADTVQRLGALLGSTFVDGGKHPGFGTRNFILPVANGMYVEVVTTLDHPSTEQSVFAQAVKRRYEEGGGWLGWVISVDDITEIEKNLGREAVSGHRRRPDGFDLQWKQIGVKDVLTNPEFPFFIQWLTATSEHPSRNSSELKISSLSLAGSETTLYEYLGIDFSLTGVELEWITSEDLGLISVNFVLPDGRTITID